MKILQYCSQIAVQYVCWSVLNEEFASVLYIYILTVQIENLSIFAVVTVSFISTSYHPQSQ